MLDDAELLAKGLEMLPDPKPVDGIFKAVPVNVDNNLSEDSDVVGSRFFMCMQAYLLVFIHHN